MDNFKSEIKRWKYALKPERILCRKKQQKVLAKFNGFTKRN